MSHTGKFWNSPWYWTYRMRLITKTKIVFDVLRLGCPETYMPSLERKVDTNGVDTRRSSIK